MNIMNKKMLAVLCCAAMLAGCGSKTADSEADTTTTPLSIAEEEVPEETTTTPAATTAPPETTTPEPQTYTDELQAGYVYTFDNSAGKEYDYPLASQKLDEIGWDLYNAFWHCFTIEYYGQAADMPEDDTTSMEWYADYGFTNGKGNCYVMAAMFCEMARLLGYEAHMISGSVPLADGSYGPHCWVEVFVDGKGYICDPDFSYDTGLDGYMKYYGEPGTWQYIKDKTMS